jgi:hypothetical protein
MATSGDLRPGATGVEAAALFDLLLELGADFDDALAWAPEQRVQFVEEAISRGTIDEARASTLRELGVLPPR